MSRKDVEVLVAGAGPAGLAAACCASEGRRQVAIVDDNPAPGGQIWRGESQRTSSPRAAFWLRRLAESSVETYWGSRVVGEADADALLVDRDEGLTEIYYKKLIIATGARELFLPFPGWTLPNVVGVGGIQALVKSGLPIEGRKVIVAGSGPLLLAVAAYLKKRGARIALVAEQAPLGRLLRFGFRLSTDPSKLIEALRFRWQLGGTRYATGCWPVAASGEGQLESVIFSDGRRSWEQICDYLACGFGLVPNLELPLLLGCEVRHGAVKVDAWQQTTLPAVYCAGETTGIGGLELSLAEGQVAGWAAAELPDRARRLFAARTDALRFKESLDRAFALRDELKELPRGDTIVCRCEDVPFNKLQGHSSWRVAKLQSRCGMGPCQGRVCGPSVEFLFGWRVESVRPPIFPTPLAGLGKHEDSEAGCT